VTDIQVRVDEARAWFRGERSSWNTYSTMANAAETQEGRAQVMAMSAVEDAACLWSALAVLRADREGLLSPSDAERLRGG
jgi:hypothetical protein